MSRNLRNLNKGCCCVGEGCPMGRLRTIVIDNPAAQATGADEPWLSDYADNGYLGDHLLNPVVQPNWEETDLVIVRLSTITALPTWWGSEPGDWRGRYVLLGTSGTPDQQSGFSFGASSAANDWQLNQNNTLANGLADDYPLGDSPNITGGDPWLWADTAAGLVVAGAERRKHPTSNTHIVYHAEAIATPDRTRGNRESPVPESNHPTADYIALLDRFKNSPYIACTDPPPPPPLVVLQARDEDGNLLWAKTDAEVGPPTQGMVCDDSSVYLSEFIQEDGGGGIFGGFGRKDIRIRCYSGYSGNLTFDWTVDVIKELYGEDQLQGENWSLGFALITKAIGGPPGAVGLATIGLPAGPVGDPDNPPRSFPFKRYRFMIDAQGGFKWKHENVKTDQMATDQEIKTIGPDPLTGNLVAVGQWRYGNPATIGGPTTHKIDASDGSITDTGTGFFGGGPNYTALMGNRLNSAKARHTFTVDHGFEFGSNVARSIIQLVDPRFSFGDVHPFAAYSGQHNDLSKLSQHFAPRGFWTVEGCRRCFARHPHKTWALPDSQPARINQMHTAAWSCDSFQPSGPTLNVQNGFWSCPTQNYHWVFGSQVVGGAVNAIRMEPTAGFPDVGAGVRYDTGKLYQFATIAPRQVDSGTGFTAMLHFGAGLRSREWDAQGFYSDNPIPT